MCDITTLRPEKRSIGVQVAMINYVGYKRHNNEDNCCINDFYIPLEQMNDNVSCTTTEHGQKHLFGVFDGVGGDARGEVASSAAAAFFAANRDQVLSACADQEAMTECFRLASNHVRDIAQDSSTTAALLCIRGATAYVSNAGDSSVFFCHDGILETISQEHTWAAQMGGDPTGRSSHAILRYLGEAEEHALYTPFCATPVPLETGDTFLLCSDGLTDMVSHEAILQILCSNQDPSEAVSALVNAALEGGGVDNVTALLLKITLLPESCEG